MHVFCYFKKKLSRVLVMTENKQLKGCEGEKWQEKKEYVTAFACEDLVSVAISFQPYSFQVSADL